MHLHSASCSCRYSLNLISLPGENAFGFGSENILTHFSCHCQWNNLPLSNHGHMKLHYLEARYTYSFIEKKCCFDISNSIIVEENPWYLGQLVILWLFSSFQKLHTIAGPLHSCSLLLILGKTLFCSFETSFWGSSYYRWLRLRCNAWKITELFIKVVEFILNVDWHWCTIPTIKS